MKNFLGIAMLSHYFEKRSRRVIFKGRPTPTLPFFRPKNVIALAALRQFGAPFGLYR